MRLYLCAEVVHVHKLSAQVKVEVLNLQAFSTTKRPT